MIRTVLLLLFLTGIVLGATTVDRKIKKTSKVLNSYSKSYKELNRKMAKTAEAIMRLKKKIASQQQTILQLEKELNEKSTIYKTSQEQLLELQKFQKKLKSSSNEVEEQLVFAIAKSVSLSVLLDEQYTQNIDTVIELEILKAKLEAYKKKIKNYNKKYFQLSSNINQINYQTTRLKNAIAKIDAKKKRLLKIQKKTKKDLHNLKLAKSTYRKSLKKLLKKQDELKRTLSRLNIVKIDEEKRKKEKAQQERAFARTSQKQISTKNMPKVKRYGKSYQSVRTKRYRGAKTIAPLKSYTITKKYGTYTDPIYGIKIFNESISMKPRKQNARVYNVFNGKVIYADKTAVLNNLVIIEHKNGLHTIYANLSKIAPNIRKGKRIKKGYVIGRVQNELIFEVTQKSYHINPIRLFR